MNLDYDFYRDAAVSFGAESLLAGAMLPYEGRKLAIGVTKLASGVELVDAALDVAEGWLLPDCPVFVRGKARIVPLVWRGDPQRGHGTGVKPEEIKALVAEVEAAFDYWGRRSNRLELTERRSDSIGSYAAALQSAGATRVDCVTCSHTTGAALVRAGAEEEGTWSMALHFVPAPWVSERLVGKPVRGIDVSWSWTDVIALYAEREASAPESRDDARP